jgi:hypothetical protein
MDFARDIGYHVFGTGPCKVLALRGWFGDEGRVVQLQARQQFLNNQMVPPPAPLPVDWIYGYDAVNVPLTRAEESQSA